MEQYNELCQSRDWCAINGYESMKRWYMDELEFHGKRRALPLGVQSFEEPVDDRRRSRWDR